MDYNQIVHSLASNLPTMTAILIAWLANNNRLKVLETKIDNLNAPMDRIESRLDRIEGRMDMLDARLDKLDERVRGLELFNAGGAALLSK